MTFIVDLSNKKIYNCIKEMIKKNYIFKLNTYTMKNLTSYSHIVEKGIQENKVETRKILDKFEDKFNKGSLTCSPLCPYYNSFLHLI